MRPGNEGFYKMGGSAENRANVQSKTVLHLSLPNYRDFNITAVLYGYKDTMKGGAEAQF